MTLFMIVVGPGPTHAQFFSKKTQDLLPEDQAFRAVAIINQGKLSVNWSIANDYYMYRDQFSIASTTAGVEIGDITFPPGTIENDPEFGKVEVYFYSAELTAPIHASNNEIELILKGQGCNKPVGVCYPPQTRTLTVTYDGLVDGSVDGLANSASDTTQAPFTEYPSNTEKTFWGYVLAALGAGILLSFTPCVLPMIPILAGVIAGQNNPGKLRSGWLAICYVSGTLVTYAIAGWVAGKSGTQLQAHFQNPWVIGFICGLLLLLAASLFGAFRIELPSFIQTRLSGTRTQNQSASVSSFALGLISALVVGACVSPILILTLGAAITKGDPVLGAAIMAAMATGMGSLLILFGFGAGWILPKAGAWMQHIQVIFGFMVIGVAIYLISIIDVVPALYLWSALFLWSGFYLLQITHNITAPLILSVIKACGFAAILWGALSLAGAITGGSDVLRPLNTLVNSKNSAFNNTDQTRLPFQTTTRLSEVQRYLQKAKASGRPVLIDFYADWCLDCKRMHRTTFKQPSVAQALQGWDLIEIDVTDTSEHSEEAKHYFGVFGPPATLFIKSNGKEYSQLRQYGYMNETEFLTRLSQAQP